MDWQSGSRLSSVNFETIYTRRRRALGRSALWRYYAIVVTSDGRDLNELPVSAGLARIYGTRTPLPDGRDSREYLAHLRELESEAKAAKRCAWGKVNLWSTGKSSLIGYTQRVGLTASPSILPSTDYFFASMHTAMENDSSLKAMICWQHFFRWRETR
jgi:hypothetical protein